MLKKISFFLFLFITTFSFGQSTDSDLDKLLSAKFSAQEIATMKESNKEMYELYAKSFKVGVVISPNSDAVKAKGIKSEQLNISVADGEKLNYLAYNLDLKPEAQYYIINDGKSILLIRGINALKIMK